MLTRRHIRVKVLQALYAFENQEKADLKQLQQFLAESMLAMHDLHLVLLDLQLAIHRQAINYMERAKKKFLATSEDMSPSTNFVENQVLLQLEKNTILQNLLQHRKLNCWELDSEYPQILFKILREDPVYTKYLHQSKPTFAQDQEFVLYLYKNIIAPNDKLYDYLEDKKLTWADDIPIVNTAIVKIIENCTPTSSESHWVPELFKSDDDRKFAHDLMDKTLIHDAYTTHEIETRTPNWDKDRIAELDMMLIKMGITEFLHFPTIPIRVTINEYIEIAKEYSTPKSSIFINGIMDKIVKDLEIKGMLKKTGRGVK